MTLRATVNVDASFCPRTRAAGWAAWISIDGGAKIKWHGKFNRPPKTSSEAELWAIFNGIWLAANARVTDVLVQSDCRAALLHLERDTAQTRFMRTKLPHPVTVRTKHVKAHTDTSSPRTWVNDWCDKMAKIHMREQRKGCHLNPDVG